MDHATLVIDQREERRPEPSTRYEDDAHAWAFEQAALLRAGRLNDLDLINLADEIEDVGNREYDKLESNLALVVQHLLKWDYQESRRSRSWSDSVREHRKRVNRQLKKFPSLKSRQAEWLEEAYEHGRGNALIETGLPESTFPEANCYSWDEIMRRLITWPAS